MARCDRLWVLSLLSALCVVSSFAQTMQPSAPYDDPEAYKVYAAILPQEWTWKVAHAKTLIIRIETESFPNCVQLDNEAQPSVREALAAYVRQNKEKWLLQRSFDIEKPYELVYSDQIKAIFENGGDGWQNFNERFPDSGGLIEFSAVGFNAGKTVAVVYMGHQCGSLCGGGTQHILQKKDGQWQHMTVAGHGSSCTWVS